MLHEARRLATQLAGGDASNIPTVHPIRWPGSWHRKKTPKLARDRSDLAEDTEIDLGRGAGAGGRQLRRPAWPSLARHGAGIPGEKREASHHSTAVVQALAVIPNGTDPRRTIGNTGIGPG